MVRKLKSKNSTCVESSKVVMITSKAADVDSLDEISREERKREASKPLYLVRYE